LDEVGFLDDVSRYKMLPGAAEAIARLNAAGMPVIVVSNQSGVARGYFAETMVGEVNALMQSDLAKSGAALTAIYYCVHGPDDACECRKPKLGMVRQAEREHAIEAAKSFFVGDRRSDVELGHNAGGKSVLVRTGYGEKEHAFPDSEWKRRAEFVAGDLGQAVDWILKQGR
jgi:D-glycero-D-manno-heptose 1,7-bisphosphate phosphatase